LNVAYSTETAITASNGFDVLKEVYNAMTDNRKTSQGHNRCGNYLWI